jgi:putative endonuclease
MQQADKRGKKNEIGALGEAVACRYLVGKSFEIMETNYLRKWGEIDIVAREKKALHFVEVKTVSYGTRTDLEQAISRETWRPEDNVHSLKLKRLSRAIESWLLENKYEGEWQIDVLAVRLVPREKYATVKLVPNVVLD